MILCDIPIPPTWCDDEVCNRLGECKHGVLCEICESEDRCTRDRMCYALSAPLREVNL